MGAAWETVRVFISSTFRDTQAERDHLVRFVFPRLREELLKRRIHLVDVDLRWGVTSEQDAMSVCREIIDKCNWFVCILGGRYGWIPPGQACSITAAEIHYAALDQPRADRHCLFFFRDPRATDSIPRDVAVASGFREYARDEEVKELGPEQAQERAQERAEKLDQLKQAILQAGYHPFVFPARWDATQQRLVELTAFGERVYADLLAGIDAGFPPKPLPDVDERAEETAATEGFIEEHVEHYVEGSRQGLLDQMTAFAEARDEPGLMLVTGAAGAGKSTLLGKFCRTYAGCHPSEIVIPLFIGASRRSTELRYLLRSLCEELAAQAGLRDPVPEGMSELRQAFPAFLHKAAESRRVVILLDGLNQLDARDYAHAMRWLPEQLPTGVRVILSSREHPALAAAQQRWPGAQTLDCGPLTREDAEALVDGFLAYYHKTFAKGQRKALLAKQDCYNPLYLTVALRELRTMGVYEEITVRTTQIDRLPGTVMELFAWILNRLERGVEGQSAFGTALVSAYASYIAAGRGGIPEAELEALCRLVDQERQFQVLQLMLRPYLVSRGPLVDFFHERLREAVMSKYLGNDHERQRRHAELAEHLQRQGCDYSRTLSELPYHRYRSAQASGDASTLFELVDDAEFRRRQLACLHSPAQVAECIGYAVDQAIQRGPLSRLVRYTMMRSRVAGEAFAADVGLLVSLSREHPQKARAVIGLIPYQTLRRVAFLFAAWYLAEGKVESDLVPDLVADAASVRVPATLGQVPVLLDLVWTLYSKGYEAVADVLGMVPECPVRQAYQAAWAGGPERSRLLAAAMARAAGAPKAPGEEIREFAQVRELVARLEGKRGRRAGARAFEEEAVAMLGPSRSGEAHFLLASESLRSGRASDAAILINRGIYSCVAWSRPAIRTLAAFVELLGRAGERALAEDHADRVRTLARGLESLARAEFQLGQVQDALSDLSAAEESAARAWKPTGVTSLAEGSLGSASFDGPGERFDAEAGVARARRLLARGHTASIPQILRDALAGLGGGEDGEQAQGALTSLYALARACGASAVAAECAARLQEAGISPDALYLPGAGTKEASLVLAAVAASDPRCAASAALCLRLAGRTERLLELLQVASDSGASADCLDAILSQVVRLPGSDLAETRRAGEELVGVTAKSLSIPSGLGWLYFPGFMLLTAWTGVVCAAAGARAAFGVPHLPAVGALWALAGLAGGCLDLVIWRKIHLWDRPEVSRQTIWPELGSLASLWLVAWLTWRWVKPAGNVSMGAGASAAVLLTVALTLVLARRGLLFFALSRWFIAAGTVICATAAAGLAILLPGWPSRLIASSALAGAFLGGMLALGVSLSIVPKHLALLRYYRARQVPEKSICSPGGTG